ncbi:hypothetical protein ACOSP7_027802 [Xanthoceras sorbifolium]
MGHRCCSKQKVKKGLWSPEEDEKLLKHITTYGHGSWSSIPKLAGLQRCGKSCRLRWINYLRPDLRRGSFTEEEEQIIIDVHRILGNRWAQIAKHLPGRTDNEVKNFWNSCIKKKLLSQGLDPKTHNLIPSHQRAAKSNNKMAFNNNISPSIPVFTVNSHMTSNVPLENIKPPFLTLPPPPPTPISPPNYQSTLIQPTMAIPIPATSSDYQNPNFVWNANNNNNNNNCGQNSYNPTTTTFPNVSSIDHHHHQRPISSTSSSSSLVNPPSGFGLLDENYCMWGTNNSMVVEPFGGPSNLDGNQQQQQQQQVLELQHEKGQVCEMETDKIDEVFLGFQDNMDSSFDSSSFDFEFVESTFMSGAICRDLSSMDDFAWNF